MTRATATESPTAIPGQARTRPRDMPSSGSADGSGVPSAPRRKNACKRQRATGSAEEPHGALPNRVDQYR